MEKKASLQQSVSVQEQYEKLLQDYADFLETAEDKLKTEAIAARDLDHLSQQLNAHKVDTVKHVISGHSKIDKTKVLKPCCS